MKLSGVRPPTSAAFWTAQTVLVLVIALAATQCGSELQELRHAAPPEARILFDSDRDGNPGIYVMDPDGSNPQRLTDGNGSAEGPAWSPDRKKIAFSSVREGHQEIFIMDADGSNPQQLTRTVDKDSGNPNWSPDGKRIAFESNRDRNFPNRDGDREVYDIYAMDADGSNVQRLTHTEGFGVSENPDWSLDGTRIGFDRNGEIYVMDPDGRNLQRLTPTAAKSSHPMWSPDGKRITFMSRRDGNMEIYVMDADGANVRKLSNTPVGRSLGPDWSPDGKKIVFGSERDGNMEIYVMNADGSDLRNLTLNGARDAHPAW